MMGGTLDPLDMQFERVSTIVTRRVAGETILVPIAPQVDQDSALYTLDEVAAYLWDLLDGRHTGRDLAASLTDRYQVSTKQAGGDVRTFLEQLASIDAIRPAQGQPNTP